MAALISAAASLIFRLLLCNLHNEFNYRNNLCYLISFSGRVYSIFFMRINEFCMYMWFIVSLSKMERKGNENEI